MSQPAHPLIQYSVTATRYVLIAALSMALGTVASVLFGAPFEFSYVSLMFNGVVYSFMHVVALCVAALLRIGLTPRRRSKFYLILSVLGFVLSIVFLNPIKLHGVHLVVIFWGSLVVVASDYTWRVAHQSDGEGAILSR